MRIHPCDGLGAVIVKLDQIDDDCQLQHSQVNPNASVIDEHILHLEVSLMKAMSDSATRKDKAQQHTCSASSRLSNSMNAYCRESPVCLSRMTWQLMIVPKREKMSSRSSSRVTGLSLHTKSTFSGGLTLANGRSPTISRVSAAAAASRLRRASSSSSSGSVASGSSSSAMRVELSGGLTGGESGTTRPFGSSNGSSVVISWV